MNNLLPHFILEKYLLKDFNGKINTTAVFVDISGFSELTERLKDQGKQGIEILSRAINKVFSPAIESVYKREGFITSFAGDSFIALFSDKNKAVYAAFEILSHFVNEDDTFKDINIRAGIGLSSGTVEYGIVGKNKNKTYYFKGMAISSACMAQNNGNTMSITVDKTALSNIAEIKQHSGSLYELIGIRIPEKKIEKKFILSDYSRNITGIFISDLLLKYRPSAEIRDISSVFISFKNLDEYEDLNDFATDILDITDNWGGYFHRISFDDKKGNILLSFGIPVSYENNIQRACNCVNEIINIYNKNIRAGITFGRLFTGFMGSELRSAYDVLGESVNLSSRIAMKANWGEAWITRDIQKEINPFFKSIYTGEFHFKGKADREKIFKLADKKGSHDLMYRGKHYGRESDLKTLKQKCMPVFDNRSGGIVYILGEPGIGKSRLVYELIKSMEYLADLCIMQCDSIIKKPWNPFLYYFKNYFLQNPNHSDSENEDNFDKVFNCLIHELMKLQRSHDIDIIKTLGNYRIYIKAFLSLNIDDNFFSKLDAKQIHQNTVFAIIELFKAKSIIKPVIIHLEDIQYIDNESKILLESLIRNTIDYPIITLSTGRLLYDGTKPCLNLEKNIKNFEMHIKRISGDSIRDLIMDYLQRSPSEELIKYIIDKTEANPFYAQQFCLFLIENDLLVKRNNKYYLKNNAEAIPSRINQIIVARIDRLTNPLRDLVKVASVFGREFNSEILFKTLENIFQIAESGKGILSINNETISIIKGILKAGIDKYLSEGKKENLWHSDDNFRYIFMHALLKETAYELQLEDTLRFLHKIIACTIEKIYCSGGDIHKEYYPDLCYHFEKACMTGKTMEYLKKSADYLKDTFKNNEAISFYEKLLEYELPPEEKISIMHSLGFVYEIVGSLENAEKILERSIQISERLQDKYLLSLSNDHYGHLISQKSEYGKALIHLMKAEKLARELEDTSLLIEIYNHIGIIHNMQGRFEEALEFYKKAIGYHHENSQEIAQIYNNIGEVYRNTGQYDKALEYYHIARDISAKSERILLLTAANLNIGAVYFIKGDYNKSLDYFQYAYEIGEKSGAKNIIGIALGNMGSIYYKLGNYIKALKLLEKRMKVARELGDKRGLGVALSNIAEIYLIRDTSRDGLEKVMAMFRERKELSEEIGDKLGIGVSLGKIGKIYYLRKDYEKALKYIEKALDILKKYSDFYIVEILYDKAEILLNLGKYIESLKVNALLKTKLKTNVDEDISFKAEIQKQKIDALLKGKDSV